MKLTPEQLEAVSRALAAFDYGDDAYAKHMRGLAEVAWEAIAPIVRAQAFEEVARVKCGLVGCDNSTLSSICVGCVRAQALEEARIGSEKTG